MAVDDIHGYIVALTERTMGDTFIASAGIGVQTLALQDTSDFDESGGFCLVGGTVYTYDSADLAADTVHITTGLTAGANVGDRVDIWDADNALVVSERVALVSVDDQDGDPVSATIGHSLQPLLAQGTLAEGQSVSMLQEPDSEEWIVEKVHAKSNPGVEVSRAATIYSGSGVPAFAANQGDVYIRTDDPTTSGHRVYMNTAIGSSWTGIV